MSRALEDEESPQSGGNPSDRPEREQRPAGRLHRLLPLGIWVAVVGFVVIGIGWPLVGQGVFGPTDVLVKWSPYSDTVLAGVVPKNPFLQDVADGVLPQTALFVDLVLNGNGGWWNPFMVGGTPLGAVPNNAFFSPVNLPYFLLPVWLAPAWVKALEIVISVGGTFLFARRLGLGRPAAFIGGLMFVTSSFMLSWTGWSQTKTAAFIPLLFWAIERLVQRRRVSDAVLVCVSVAAMLFGGFPAVTGYALIAGGVYFVVRVLAEYRAQWKRITAMAVGGAAAIVGAVSLAAIQLLPFTYFMSHAFVFGREQTPADNIPYRALITAIAPWSLGTTYAGGVPQWAAGTHIVEALSYVGAGALLLALVGLAAVRTGRGMLPKGVWVFLVAAIGVCLVLIYAGGPPLAAVQQLPVLFSENFVGRARSVLGFLLAVLAAVGFEVLLWRLRAAREKRAAGVAGRIWGPAVWVGAGVGMVGLFFAARQLADTPARQENFDVQVLYGLGFVAVALACVE
ncbi:MAG TPA: hypothetical protein VNO83_06470, partial [Pseudonocardia sp.]|nr:hypothetical protein [Pseudonocardia sp.]